jgi:hypothetical protein
VFTTLSQVAPGVPAAKNEYRNRALLPDGSRAFFSTPNSLVPEDHNGVYDAYEWNATTGALALISTGSSPYNSYFVEASADGRDVFFTTRERLSNRDIDNNVDLYDARSGGGFPEPLGPNSTCSGERCQGEGKPPGGAPALGSESIKAPDRQPLRLSFGSPATFRGPSGKLSVRPSASGRLTAKGSGLVTVERKVQAGKRISLRLRLDRSGRRQLSRLGALSSRARLVLVASDGQTQSSSVTVRFKKEGN